MISNPLAVLLALAAVVYVADLLAERIALFRSLGAALVAILLAMLLSNLRLLPEESPTYDFLVGPALSFGIALILLSVDLRSIVQAGPRMLAAFGLGAIGTAVGATFSGLALHSLVGPETWKLAGQYTGTYTGGGMNFAALGRAFNTSSDLFSAAIAADVAVTALWMATCLAVPVLLGRPAAATPEGEQAREPGDNEPQTLERALHDSGRPVALKDTAALMLIGLGAMWSAGFLESLIPQIPEILWLTSVVLILAQFPAVQSLAGGALWGNYLLLLFLASNGAQSVIANIFAFGPAVFYFAIGTVALHGIILFGLGRLLRIDMATLAVASQANVGGAASAMALAGARGYMDRLLPGVAVGLLGYAVGNYLGFLVAALVRQALGG